MPESLFDIEPESSSGKVFEVDLVGMSIESPIGELIAVSDHRGICWLGYPSHKDSESGWEFAKNRLGADISQGSDEFLEQLATQLKEYFLGNRTEFSVPLRLRGTDFQKEVWAALCGIPFGQTLSYSGLAEKLAIKNGQRAVGKANGDNPVSILVPCHRVVRADGDLCGYAGGLWRKQFLLALESGQAPLF